MKADRLSQNKSYTKLRKTDIYYTRRPELKPIAIKKRHDNMPCPAYFQKFYVYSAVAREKKTLKSEPARQPIIEASNLSFFATRS